MDRTAFFRGYDEKGTLNTAFSTGRSKGKGDEPHRIFQRMQREGHINRNAFSTGRNKGKEDEPYRIFQRIM